MNKETLASVKYGNKFFLHPFAKASKMSFGLVVLGFCFILFIGGISLVSNLVKQKDDIIASAQDALTNLKQGAGQVKEWDVDNALQEFSQAKQSFINAGENFVRGGQSNGAVGGGGKVGGG